MAAKYARAGYNALMSDLSSPDPVNRAVAARALGRMVVTVPLSDVVLDHLVRDRMALDEGEMEALKASLRARGQQTPVELTDLGGGRYGLISGWRRLTALRRLHAESGEDRFAEIQASGEKKIELTEAEVIVSGGLTGPASACLSTRSAGVIEKVWQQYEIQLPDTLRSSNLTFRHRKKY